MESFEAESYRLLEQLLERSKFLCDRMDLFKRETDEDSAYYGYVKNFVVTDGIICDEILAAIHNDKILISLVAARTLLEELINVSYLISRGTREERYRVANDWIKRSNSPKRHKNMLDKISVEDRAKAAGAHIKQIYDNEYAMMCDYVHGSAQRGLINASDVHRDLAGKKAIYMSLLAYSNIVFAVSTLAQLPPDYNAELEVMVGDYLKKYDEPVAKMQIDIILT